MYTSYVGKKFLTAWNAKENKCLSAREFFDDVMFKEFFDDERHLMHVANSPFFQSISSKDLASGKKESEIRRANLHASIENNSPNASIYVGYAADKVTATTSGQVSNLPVEVDSEEIYASWIGEGLSIGIAGGLYLLTDRVELLLEIYKGWSSYRQFLNQTPNLKGRQIETWNGNWIHHILTKGNANQFYPPFDKKKDSKTGQEYWAINTLDWPKLIFAFCKKYPGEVLTVYAYSLSQTNITIGFLNLNLLEVNRLHEYIGKIFIDKDESVLISEEINELVPYYSFKDAAMLGVIGLKALEPDKLRAYMPQNDRKKNKELNLLKEDSYKQFKIFKLWIYAMLNRTELLELASQVAAILHQFEEEGSERGKKVNSQLSEEIRGAVTLRLFIDKLADLIGSFPASADVSRQVIDNVVKMPVDQFPLFVTLIRFEYNYKKSKVN